MRASRVVFRAPFATPLFCQATPVEFETRRDVSARAKADVPHPVAPKSRLVFTGTGNSTGTPRPACLLSKRDDPQCRVSLLAMDDVPHRNPNYRGNPSLLIQHSSPVTGSVHNIQIDIGKTFRESLLRWYPRFGVPWLDAAILTHDHADAMMGLDELRTVQRTPSTADQTNLADARDSIPSLPVFVAGRHMPSIRRCFPYLMPKGGSTTVARFTAKIDWIETADYETFTCPGGLDITSVPVQHGQDYICQAFVFGTKDRVAYLSDTTAVPEKTMAVLEERPLKLLVVDCLFEESHPVHFGMVDALALIRHLRPERALLIGMADVFEHHETNERLRQLLHTEGLDVQLAHDGLHVDLEL